MRYTDVKCTATADGETVVLSEIPILEIEGEIEVIIQKKKKKRSLDANSYFWILADKLAQKIGSTKDLIYKEIVMTVGVWQDVAVREKDVDEFINSWEKNGLGWLAIPMESKLDGCKKVRCYKGSSCYTTAEMKRLIDEIILECKEQGIETMTPAETQQMMEVTK